LDVVAGFAVAVAAPMMSGSSENFATSSRSPGLPQVTVTPLTISLLFSLVRMTSLASTGPITLLKNS
jgi:hypothetical protein